MTRLVPSSTLAACIGGDETARTRRLVLDYVSRLNVHDPDAVAACVSEDFVNEHIARLGTSVVGREAYRERLPQFFSDFQNLHYEIETLVVEGNCAALCYRMSAHWRRGRAAHPIVVRGVFSFVARGGLIARRTDYWDSADVLTQIGHLPASEGVPR